MAGIYIHIPYCSTKCIYCDFYSTINQRGKQEFLSALDKEIRIRKDFLSGKEIATIYFGGGTPSQLTIEEVENILSQIENTYTILPTAEITFESNPDDLSEEYLKGLLKLGINRLSIGIQSFIDEELKRINRRHNSKQAKEAFLRARKLGFSNISIDIIYALPNSTLESLKYTLECVKELNPEHLSIYHLTYEKGTALYKMRNRDAYQSISDDNSSEQYEYIRSFVSYIGYKHYEISNFSYPEYESRHNSSYWKGDYYLGLGPSAHSYNGEFRFWNVKSTKLYTESLDNDILPAEKEILKIEDKYHEYIMTRFRCALGINPFTIEQKFGKSIEEHFNSAYKKHLNLGNLTCLPNGRVQIPSKDWIISDQIMLDFFMSV